MKTLLIALSVLTISVYADEAKREEMFQKVKEDMISNLDKKISAHQTAKSCIQSAAKQEELKACHKTMRDTMGKLRDERKDKKMHIRGERKERKEERKKEKTE